MLGYNQLDDGVCCWSLGSACDYRTHASFVGCLGHWYQEWLLLCLFYNTSWNTWWFFWFFCCCLIPTVVNGFRFLYHGMSATSASAALLVWYMFFSRVESDPSSMTRVHVWVPGDHLIRCSCDGSLFLGLLRSHYHVEFSCGNAGASFDSM